MKNNKNILKDPVIINKHTLLCKPTSNQELITSINNLINIDLSVINTDNIELIPKNHWGTFLWSFIHIITLNNNNIIDKKNILKNILNIIPCNKCIPIYSSYLKKLNTLDETDKLCLFKWSVEVHNEINKKIKKNILSYNEALNLWGSISYY
jgi:hypothetical protein